MHLINVDDAVVTASRGKLHVVPQVAYVINAAVGGTVDLEHIQTAPLRNLQAHILIRVKIHLGPAGAVEGLGKNARRGGLAGAARADKQVGMRQTFLLDSVAEGPDHMILTQHIAEGARTIFSCENLVTHALIVS